MLTQLISQILPTKFFLLILALNLSRFRSALRKREKNVSAFYFFDQPDICLLPHYQQDSFDMFSSRFRTTLRKREAVLTRKLFLLFHALNSSRFRSALRKREKNVSAFYVFHYNNKRWVCIALWIPKNFRYHTNRSFVFHFSDLTEMF